MKKEIKIVRSWKVYDESNKLIFECENVKDILEKFDMNVSTYLYQYKNTGKYFYTNILKNCKIRVDYVKERIETMVVTPFVIPEEKRTPIEEFDSVESEIWKHIPGTPYCNECSNKGRFRYVDSEGNYKLYKLMESKNRTKRTYYDFYVKDPEGKGYPVRAPRALVKTFLDNTFPLQYTKGDKLVVDHIDNDSTNNVIENLRIVTSSQNIWLAIHEQGTDTAIKKKKCFAKKGNDYREYDSTIELVRDITGKNNAGYFSSAIKSSGKLYGYTIGYLEN